VPTGDWQFWVVTVLAVCAAWYLVRAALPGRWAARLPRWLPGWLIGPKGRAGRRTHANLTIGGKSVSGGRGR
jgi:hypothetical protein